MNEKKIKLTGTEEVRDFVREAGKCDFDIDISYNRVIIDAKSFLGVLSLDIFERRNVMSASESTYLHDWKSAKLMSDTITL